MTTVSQLISEQSNENMNRSTWGNVLYVVTAYGIIGDSVTNATALLQQLVDLAISEGRRTIFFPHSETGEYYVTAITNADQVDFVGDNASFVGGYTGTISNFGGIATLNADLTAHEAETVSKVVLVTEPWDQVTETTVVLGFQPKNIRIEASILNTNYASSGAKDASGEYCRYYQVGVATWTIAGPSILFLYDSTNKMVGTVTITATGLTIAWVLTGAPTGATGNRRLIISATTH